MANSYPSLCRSCSRAPCGRHRRPTHFIRATSNLAFDHDERHQILMNDLTSPDHDSRVYWVKKEDGSWEERTLRGIEKALWI